MAMNIFQLISSLEQVDPDVYGRFDSRRRVFQQFSRVGQRLAATAAPLLLGALFQRAYGQGAALPAPIADVLNFALKLEYLEAAFYDRALNSAGLLPAGGPLASITLIRADETKHVAFLKAALGSQAVPALVEGPAAGNLDFTGAKGGTRAALFPTVFSSYPTFLAVAQSLEDTGVRAYKGAAPALMGNKTILEAALNIHSVEARHASRLRSLRRGTTGPGPTAPLTPTPKSWVSGDEGGGAAPPTTAPIYGPGTPAASFPGEANVTQGGVSLPGLPSLVALGLPATAFSEAFDEPLDTASVAGIALNFIVGNTF
ncbi:MAG: hypothetical protein NVSMB30_27380 [Hymenobacter sp.]